MKKIKITGIRKDSIAEELGICIGDYLISVNGQEIIDILDYKFQMSDEYVVIEILHEDELYEYEIEKEIDEDIGLIFENELIDNPKRCMNKCVFCFMDQEEKYTIRKDLRFFSLWTQNGRGVRKSHMQNCMWIERSNSSISWAYGGVHTLHAPHGEIEVASSPSIYTR